MNLIPLADNVYAVGFPYHLVTQRTLWMALPSAFKREVTRQRQEIRFAVESETEAGTKRADSEQIERVFPVEVAMLRQSVRDLAKYVIFKLV